MATNPESDTQAAYLKIRARILDGRLSPGQAISPRGLTDELELGHTPIRSAIQRLVVEGLVHVVPRKGTYVAAPTTKDLNEIFQIRLALESTAAYLAALNGPSKGLSKSVDRLQQLLDDDSTDLMAEQRAGWAFHQELFAASRNDRLLTTYQVFRAQTGLALKELPHHDIATVRRGTLEHLDIYAAIKVREPEVVRNHMWNHIVDGTDARIKLISDREHDLAH